MIVRSPLELPIHRLSDPALRPIAEKLGDGERLDNADALTLFDSPDLQTSCARRQSSTHAPQALELMNGDLSNRMALALAARIEKEAGPDAAKQVNLAYLLTAGRAPKPKERDLALAYIKEKNSTREFALALLNLNAFLYVE